MLLALCLAAALASGVAAFMFHRNLKRALSEIDLGARALTEMDETLSGLKESSARLEATLKGMQEGVLALDEAGRVLFLNPRLESLLGLAAAEAVGKPLLSVLRNPDLKTL